MRENPLKRVLDGDGVVFGLMMFELATVGAPRIADSVGADFVIWDMEHTGWTTETIRSVMGVARLGRTWPLVRVARAEHHLISTALDAGAMGVMVPMVETAEQARLIVDAAKYPPMGTRGFGAVYPDMVESGIADYCESANRETIVWPLIETAAGVRNAAAIFETPGVDGVWLGFHDLASSLGCPGQFDTPEFLDAVAHLHEVANRCGKPLGQLATSQEDAKALLDRGVRIIAAGDLMVLAPALRGFLDGMRASAP
jgi:2-keto-3-deoxy-L-rhamnonate aldolase RhmA